MLLTLKIACSDATHPLASFLAFDPVRGRFEALRLAPSPHQEDAAKGYHGAALQRRLMT
jgi:hypothetical protein